MTSCRHDPKLLTGLPIGMYHCPDCGIMVVAGLPHLTDKDCKDLDPYWEKPIYDNRTNP